MVKGIRLKFVALGDSLTVGFQSSDMFLPGKEASPYTNFLDVIFSSELPKRGLNHMEVSFKNAGMLGDSTRGMLERFDIHVAAEEPDYVIVWGGINDLFNLRLADKICGNLKQIYGKALEAEIEPIACTITPVLGFDPVLPHILELNDQIQGYCNEHGIPIADLYAATSDEAGRLRETFSSDGVHLNQAGYRKVAYTLYFEVIEIILDEFEKEYH